MFSKCIHILQKKKKPSNRCAGLQPGVNELAHDKTYNKACETIKDTNQPVHPLSMAMVLVYHSLDSLEAVEGICDQRGL